MSDFNDCTFTGRLGADPEIRKGQDGPVFHPRANAPDLEGERFGRWTVSRFMGGSKWLCICDCGTEKGVSGATLKNGMSRGCHKCKAPAHKTHGLSKTRIYKIWAGIKKRCQNKNHPQYKLYGGAGVKICDEWAENFQCFYNWAVNNGYRDDLTIDRWPDQSGNYEPKNCRFATYAQQNRNYSRNVLVEHGGDTMVMADAARAIGINPGTLRDRVFRYGWSVQKALSTPVRGG